MASKVIGSFTAAGEVSDELNGTEVLDDRRAGGVAHISIGGTFVATVNLEVRWNDEPGQPWHTSDVFAGPAQGQFRCADNADYRLVVADFTSGEVNYRMGV